MLETIQGMYRAGKIELRVPPTVSGSRRVLVTFLPDDGKIFLSDRSIDEPQAADLRARLSAFAEDWDRPEMEVYDAV